MVPIIPAAAGIATDDPSPKKARQIFSEARFQASAVIYHDVRGETYRHKSRQGIGEDQENHSIVVHPFPTVDIAASSSDDLRRALISVSN
jgi:hypothetical protein